VGVEQRGRVVVGQPLDAERHRQRHDRLPEAVDVHQLGPRGRVVLAQVDRCRRFAGQLEDPVAAVSSQARRRGPPREGSHEILGPEVLVDVDRSHRDAVYNQNPTGIDIFSAAPRARGPSEGAKRPPWGVPDGYEASRSRCVNDRRAPPNSSGAATLQGGVAP
jgi:hypothetical protein